MLYENAREDQNNFLNIDDVFLCGLARHYRIVNV